MRRSRSSNFRDGARASQRQQVDPPRQWWRSHATLAACELIVRHAEPAISWKAQQAPVLVAARVGLAQPVVAFGEAHDGSAGQYRD